MSTRDLIAVLRRRWYVVLVGVALTVGSLVWVHARPGVYWAQMDVVFVAPPSALHPNSIAQTTESLIVMAGLVERDLNEGAPIPGTASSSVTLAGEGIREGSLVRLPNAGGQWGYNFSRPVLDVQAVGPEADAVREQVRVLVEQIEATLRARQKEDGVAPRDQITFTAAPSGVQVLHLQGRESRALAVSLVLGCALTGFLAVAADRLAGARRRRDRFAA